MRATWSTEPPGGNTATSFTGWRLGQSPSWACTGSTAPAARARARRSGRAFMGTPRDVIAGMVRATQLLHPQREPAVPRPAATVLLLRDTPSGLEVLMTRRSATASFAPGAYVFPGGGIDPA